MKSPPRRAWVVAWPGGALIGVANGTLRELTYGKRVSQAAAHQVSGATAVAAFGLYFVALQRRWPLPTRSEALQVGGAWLALTVAFEFSFGRLVARQSWEELLRDYDLAHGRTWPLVLAWIAVGPAVVSAP
jgi:hypothetical protein